MSTQGADVSHWNSTTWPTTGLGFVIVKVSEGTVLDPQYEVNVARSVKALKFTGGYAFLRRDVGIDAQAKFFVEHADKRCEFLAVDNEGEFAMTQAQVKATIAAIRKYDPLHRQVLLYMSASGFFLNVGQDGNWVASWGGNGPSIPWVIWQYMSGSAAGSGGIDRNVYRGTLAEMRAALAPLPPAPPTDIEVPMLPIIDHIARKIDVAAPMTFYDLSGQVMSTGHGAVTNVDSPFKAANGTSIFYGMFARQADGTYIQILAKPSAVRDVPPCPPVVDCPPVQESPEFKDLEAQLAAAQAANATAAADEKARIAAASADAEKNRINAL